MSTVPPIRREIVVGADPTVAFEVFTAHVGRWWPLEDHSVHRAGGTVAFVDGEIVERSAEGERVVWGTVTRWEPSAAVEFSWHPGKTADHASHVAVTFTAVPSGTLVVLEHTGWEVFDDPTAARADYDQGWPVVLDRYREQANRHNPGDSGETWVALVHRPGPAAPQDGTLFEDPRFAGHLAFLTWMREAGFLVAAGPLADEPGAGMTILRLPGTDQLEHATRLATENDASVAGGFLAVSVRPWKVMLRA